MRVSGLVLSDPTVDGCDVPIAPLGPGQGLVDTVTTARQRWPDRSAPERLYSMHPLCAAPVRLRLEGMPGVRAVGYQITDTSPSVLMGNGGDLIGSVLLVALELGIERTGDVRCGGCLSLDSVPSLVGFSPARYLSHGARVHYVFIGPLG